MATATAGGASGIGTTTTGPQPLSSSACTRRNHLPASRATSASALGVPSMKVMIRNGRPSRVGSRSTAITSGTGTPSAANRWQVHASATISADGPALSTNLASIGEDNGKVLVRDRTLQAVNAGPQRPPTTSATAAPHVLGADQWKHSGTVGVLQGGHFEFLELAVPGARRRGLGGALHDELLAGLPTIMAGWARALIFTTTLSPSTSPGAAGRSESSAATPSSWASATLVEPCRVGKRSSKDPEPR